jgi:ribosomal-protein-alanine N-acetyltransferase
MEIANIMVNGDVSGEQIRVATRSDAGGIMKLLQTAVYRHLHVDWYVPGDWLGTPGFVVKIKQDDKNHRSQFVKFVGVKEKVEACLAIAADPMPTAWVRIAALSNEEKAKRDLRYLMETAVSIMKEAGVRTVAWLAVDQWVNDWLAEFGFEESNALETYLKEDNTNLDLPSILGLDIRPALDQDMERLSQIEAQAFAPLWQHSTRSLQVAKNQAFSFDVALVDDQLVGFQLSTPNDYGVHLVRMTIDPAFQDRGIGTALMVHAIDGYYRRDRYRITLNTQLDNVASQQLYKKFGFQTTGQTFPIWTRNLS